jgi:hypothetical protein
VTRFIIFMKRATASGAFASYIYKTRSASRSQLRGVWRKRATDSDAFRPRHWQWRAAIRIFEILRFSLLFLIIIIINKNGQIGVAPPAKQHFYRHIIWSILPKNI